MDKEIWKDIEGYEGLYQVSNFGRIKSLKRTSLMGRSLKEKILKQSKNTKGYYQVGLYSKKPKTIMVHILVAQTFIPKPNNKHEINHIDGCKTNNRVGNLEWCTHHENMKHASSKNLFKQRKLSIEQAEKIKSEYIRYSKSCNINSLAKKYNVSPGVIRGILYNRTYKK